MQFSGFEHLPSSSDVFLSGFYDDTFRQNLESELAKHPLMAPVLTSEAGTTFDLIARELVMGWCCSLVTR